ncbi:hypothetical protein ACMBCN_03340, partial [Candidatus Liberibacter asiaticus]|nr:hypothetical protein [Candidatus Liberibacter asiaticus]
SFFIWPYLAGDEPPPLRRKMAPKKKKKSAYCSTHWGLPVICWRKVETTSSPHGSGPYTCYNGNYNGNSNSEN